MAGELDTKQAVAKGTAMGAAILLVTVGVLQIFQGIAAIAKDEVFVTGIEYIYKFDFTTWGWIHLILGILVTLTVLVLFTGALWARFAAICILCLSNVANFLWLPYYPWWSILIIALDVVVIWAIVTWNPDRVDSGQV